MKRASLVRKTPLKRGPGPKRTGNLNPVSKRRQKRDKPYAQARREVFDRGDGICEASTYGVPCGQPMDDTHHIRGRNVPDPHALSNLIGLCWWHHRKAHAEPAWAYETGLMRRRNGDGAA